MKKDIASHKGKSFHTNVTNMEFLTAIFSFHWFIIAIDAEALKLLNLTQTHTTYSSCSAYCVCVRYLLAHFSFGISHLNAQYKSSSAHSIRYSTLIWRVACKCEQIKCQCVDVENQRSDFTLYEFLCHWNMFASPTIFVLCPLSLFSICKIVTQIVFANTHLVLAAFLDKAKKNCANSRLRRRFRHARLCYR